MFFLNLSALEFFALFGSLGGLVTALYLLDRRKRKRVVSTLRFWAPAATTEERRSRRHMQQPWSYLLQLLSLALLLLAIADLQWGARPGRGRDHVLLIDTSAWSGARRADGTTVMDDEKSAAQAYLRRLPSNDRALLVRTDALSTPSGSFTGNRRQLYEDLRRIRPGFSSLDLDGAFRFASGAAHWSDGGADIVYIGPGKVTRPPTAMPPNARAISIPSPGENCGIRSIRVTGNGAETGWRAILTLGNDGVESRRVRVLTSFGGTRFAPRTYQLSPQSETRAEYSFTTRVSGDFKADLELAGGVDAIEADNHTQVALPLSAPQKVIAYTRRRALLAPLLEAGHELAVTYLDPDSYTPSAHADVLFFDQFTPPKRPSHPALYLYPDGTNSPLPVKSVAHNTELSSWSPDGLRQIGSGQTGLHEKEMRFGEARVFQLSQDDITLASIRQGPVIAARNATERAPRMAAVGFDFLAPELRAQLTTPLLLANLLHWLSPEAFRSTDFSSERIGAFNIPLDAGETLSNLQLRDARGRNLPFSIRNASLQIFVDAPETVHLVSETRERVLSFSLPDVARNSWTPEPSRRISSGTSFGLGSPVAALDLWRWLALGGAAGLILEWFLFGRARQMRKRAFAVRGPTSRTESKVRERVSA